MYRRKFWPLRRGSSSPSPRRHVETVSNELRRLTIMKFVLKDSGKAEDRRKGEWKAEEIAAQNLVVSYHLLITKLRRREGRR